MSNEVNKALENLAAIKSGDDPRATEPETTQEAASPEPEPEPATTPEEAALLDSDDGLEVAEAEVDRLYDEYHQLPDNLPRDKLHVGVSRNDGRNGVCKYNKRLTKRRFNKQITQTERQPGHVIVVINEKILEQGNRDEFIDTLRHEVAHGLAYAMHDKYPSRQKHRDYDPYFKGHGEAWKQLAALLGADPSSCHNKRDRSNEFNYYIGCTECDTKAGKTKRSKVIKQPFSRMCGNCGSHGMVSWDAGDERPTEPGTVAVESLPWDNQEEWVEAGCP